MKVLVTGAAGRVGANVVRRLVAADARVRAFVVPGDPHAAKLAAFAGVEIVEGDLCDAATVAEACLGVTHVVHLAAQMVRGGTEVGRYYEVNSLSTLRLLEAARRHGGVERFVLASTDATFRPGDEPPVPLTEEARQRPVNHYGMSKLLGEVILRERAAEYGIPFSIVRYASVLSPDEADRFFRLSFLRGWVATQYAEGKESTVWPLLVRPDLTEIVDAAARGASPGTAAGFVGPDGPWRLSMLDVRDAAAGTCLALSEPGAVGRSFNLASGPATSHEEGAAAVSEVFGVPKLLIDMPMTWNLEFSIDAARRHLGYRPEYDYRSNLLAARTGEGFVPAGEGDDGSLAKLAGR